MQKLKKREIYMISSIIPDGFFEFSIFKLTRLGETDELLCRFQYNFHSMNSLGNLIADNVQLVIDDVNRFLCLKNYAFTDKALFYVENELFNIFNGYSLDFKK